MLNNMDRMVLEAARDSKAPCPLWPEGKSGLRVVNANGTEALIGAGVARSLQARGFLADDLSITTAGREALSAPSAAGPRVGGGA